MRHRRALAVAAVILLVGSAGCGGPSAAEQRAKKEASAAAKAKADAKAEADRRAEELAARQERYDQCRTTSADLIEQLQTLDSKLSVGMVFRDYNDAVGTAQVALDAMVRTVKADETLKNDLINSGCTERVLMPLGKAMAKYAHASDVWNDCFEDLYCDIDDGPEGDKVDADWLRASELIENGVTHLQDLAPDETPTGSPSPSASGDVEES